VAQIFNLLYRRVALGMVSDAPTRSPPPRPCGMQFRDTAQRGRAATKHFGVRPEAKLFAERTVQFVVQISHAAFPVGFACEKRCRRCALPPQSKNRRGSRRFIKVMSVADVDYSRGFSA